MHVTRKNYFIGLGLDHTTTEGCFSVWTLNILKDHSK